METAKNQMVKPVYNDDGIELHPAGDFDGMRKAGRLAAETLDMITEHVVPGAVTADLDKMIELFITRNGAIPPPSDTVPAPPHPINHVVCHGIPSRTKLVEGDIVNTIYRYRRRMWRYVQNVFRRQQIP